MPIGAGIYIHKISFCIIEQIWKILKYSYRPSISTVATISRTISGVIQNQRNSQF